MSISNEADTFLIFTRRPAHIPRRLKSIRLNVGVLYGISVLTAMLLRDKEKYSLMGRRAVQARVDRLYGIGSSPHHTILRLLHACYDGVKPLILYI